MLPPPPKALGFVSYVYISSPFLPDGPLNPSALMVFDTMDPIKAPPPIITAAEATLPRLPPPKSDLTDLEILAIKLTMPLKKLNTGWRATVSSAASAISSAFIDIAVLRFSSLASPCLFCSSVIA